MTSEVLILVIGECSRWRAFDRFYDFIYNTATGN